MTAENIAKTQQEIQREKCSAKLLLVGKNPWSPCPYDAVWKDPTTGKLYCIAHGDQIARSKKEMEIERGEFT